MEIMIDNSAISMLSCSRKFQLRVVEGKVEPSNDAAAFGSTVHKILEHLDKGDDVDTMIAKVHKDNNSSELPKALSLVTFYKASKTLPPPIETLTGQPFVEIKFKHKYGSFMLPNSHKLLDIYLTGTIDRCHVEDDTLVIIDYKTFAGVKPASIQEKLDEYALSFQLPFYFYALKNFGILPAVYADYLQSRKYRMEIHLLCHNASPPVFKKHVRHAFNDDFIDREVPLIINSKIQEAINIASLTGTAPHTGFTVYKACNKCGFRPACLVLGTSREEEILSRYEIKPYDPLSFR